MDTWKMNDAGTLVLDRPKSEPVSLEAPVKILAGTMEKIADIKIFNVPLGAAGLGLVTVSAVDALRGLLAGVIPAATPVWLIPAAGAVLVNTRMVRDVMGDLACNAAGLILTADAIQALFNVRGIISGLVGGTHLGRSNSNLAGSLVGSPADGSVVQQAQLVMDDYYAGLQGGR